ncbi:hypothetical protein ACFQZZ_01070 [Nocardia sp. GCM10030253]|uniref:hypothetical protein n=1 Tax=Nocardia sp. GCM10030253 TaxID=3273404 RepID=UPI00363CD033
MPKKVGGKTFHTREELEARGVMPSPEEIARNQKILDDFNRTLRNAPPAPEGEAPGFGGRFSDDLGGTEFEGWTRDPKTGEWFDKKGRPAYYADGRRITYNEEPHEQRDPQQ